MGPSTSSGRKTADATIATRPCILKSIILEGDGTNAATVTLYDSASAASGTVLAKLLLPASADQCIVFDGGPEGIECLNGIYADVSGTGAAYIVHYALK